MAAVTAGDEPKPQTQCTGLTPAFSIFLDLLRFTAALLVVIGHLTQPLFSKGWPNLIGMSFSMVAVFFVLSGFVIRHTAAVKPFNTAAYFISRLARIYSVLIPAIFFTVAVDSLSRLINPNFYNIHFYEATTHLLLRILSTLFFVTQTYGNDITLMSNSPMWSLGYEAPYYFMFGVFFYVRGLWRWLLALTAIAIQGPNIFVFFPLWLAGCQLYNVTQTCKRSPQTGVMFLALFVVLSSLFYHLSTLTWPTLPAQWQWLAMIWRGRSFQFQTFYAAGILTITGILAAHHLQDYCAKTLLIIRKPVKALAGASFSIYLYHFPLLVLARATIGYDKSSVPAKLCVLLFVFLVCFCLAQVTEKKKHVWSQLMTALWLWLANLVTRTNCRPPG